MVENTDWNDSQHASQTVSERWNCFIGKSSH